MFRITLQSSPVAYSQMTVHDGPGILSPRILSSTHTSSLHLSSYQGYVRYSGMVNGRIVTAYTHAKNHPHQCDKFGLDQ